MSLMDSGKTTDGNGLWQIVKGAGEITLTTATLPLAIARSTFSLYQPTIIPDVPIENMEVQKDFNEYIYASLTALDKAVTETTVTISDTPPTENVVMERYGMTHQHWSLASGMKMTIVLSGCHKCQLCI
jgi:hypothetical protein